MKILFSPLKVFILCLVIGVFSLLANGTFFQLYKLNRDQETLNFQIVEAQKQILEIEKNIKLSKDPIYMEKQAFDNLDFATEDDLIFVFSDEDNS